MDFYNKFKSFLGLNTEEPRHQFNEGFSRSFHERHENFENSDETQDNFNIFSSSTMTDPLGMHKYFQQQMDEMLRNFLEFSNEQFSNFPQLEAPPPSSNSDELRDQFLKPSYQQPSHDAKDRADQDLDGKDLEAILSPPPSRNKSFFTGQSMTTRTIFKGDEIETHKTIKNSDGSEETTISIKKGNEERTIIKKRDKNGREEQEEIVVENPNMKSIRQSDDNNEKWNIYDRFFKF